MRPSFEQIYMSLAESLSQRSTCSRLKVGTVITSPDFRRVLSVGYNGNAAGLSNCCDSDDAGACGCCHSEINACIKCAYDGAKMIFVTHSPCKMCAKALINLGGIERMYYKERYRDDTGLKLLQEVGISVLQME